MTDQRIESADDGTLIQPEPEVWPRRVSLAVVGAGVLWAALLARSGWFYYDDFANVTIARDMGLSWDYLSRDVFGHFSPGLLFPIWVVAVVGHGVYLWAAASTVFWFGSLLLLVDRTAAALGAVRWARTAAVSLTAVNVALDPSLLWWAAQLNTIPAAVGGLLLLLGHVRWVEGRWWGLPVAVGGFAWSLACTEGAVLFLIPVLTVTWFWLADGPARERLRFMLRLWGEWLAYGAPVVIMLGIRAAGSYSAQGSAPPLGELIRFPWFFAAKGFAPAQFGWTIGRFELGGSALLTAGVSVVLGLALATWFVRQVGAPALVAIGTVAAVLLLRAWLIGYARLTLLGQLAAEEPRYIADMIWLSPVMAAAAWSRREASRREHRRILVMDVWFPRAIVPLGIVIVLSLIGQAAALHNGQSIGSRDYYDAFRSSLSKAEAANPSQGVSVLDTAVPHQVIGPQFGPFVFASRTVDLGLQGVRYNDPDLPLYAADDAGELHPVTLVRYAELVLDGAFTTTGSPALTSTRPHCWTPAREPTVLWIPLTAPVTSLAWVLDLHTSGSAGISEISLLVAGSEPLRRVATSPHGYRNDRWLVSGHPFAGSQLGFELVPGQELCLASGELLAPTRSGS